MGRNVLEMPGITWPQFSLSKEWRVYERARFILRWDANNPFKSPNYGSPDTTYNLQNLSSFGRVGTSTRGGFSDIGTAQPNHLLVFRLRVVIGAYYWPTCSSPPPGRSGSRFSTARTLTAGW